jgi:DNA-binding Lrp family transcriptional regulator
MIAYDCWQIGSMAFFMRMDDIDHAIVAELRAEGRLTNQELADRVGLTPAPCLRRVRRLEESGVITGYCALVDPSAVGESFEVLLHADLAAKDAATVDAFERRVASMPEVVELRRMFGIPDYFIRVRVSDVTHYEHWLAANIMGDTAIARMDSRLTMKLIKSHLG